MSFFKKPIFFLILCLFVFALIVPAVASATVTCCACEGESETCSTRPPITCVTSWEFQGYSCIREDRTCAHTCSDGTETSPPRTGEWRPYTAVNEDERVSAKGSVVTCCSCSGAHICQAVDQACDTICGDREFLDRASNWIRVSETTSEGREGPAGAATDVPLVEPQEPNIQIPIPGFIGFSEVKVQSEGEGEGATRYIDVPWIGEYFAAIFNWLMAIVGGVATVMVMIGGFIYLTAAGDQGRVSKAKEMISNALVGLLLAVGSYLILYTINPDLVSFKSIRLDIIGRKGMDFIVEPSEAEIQEYTVPGALPSYDPSSYTPRMSASGIPEYYQGNYGAPQNPSPWASTCCGSGPPPASTCSGPRQSRETRTIAESGCGLTSMAMVLQYLYPNQRITPAETALRSDTGCHVYPAGGAVRGTTQKIWRGSTEIRANLERINNLLREGYPVIMNCGPCIGLNRTRTGTMAPARAHGGHFMVLTGYDGNGYSVNDPGSNPNWRIEFIPNEMMQAMLQGERNICARFNNNCREATGTCADLCRSGGHMRTFRVFCRPDNTAPCQ